MTTTLRSTADANHTTSSLWHQIAGRARSAFPRRARNRNSTRRRSRRLFGESLEARQLMTVDFYGGNVLPHVETQAVFLGQDWSANANLYREAGSVEGFLQNVVNSSYMDMLSYAGYGVGRGTNDSGIIENSNIDKGYYLNDSTIRSDLQSLISQGYLAEPDPNRLYVVYIEPGVAVMDGSGATSINDFMGYHTDFGGSDRDGYSADIRYAVIAYPGGYNRSAASNGLANDFDQLTQTTSHELAEAVTDPDPGSGWIDPQARPGDEIGDIAMSVSEASRTPFTVSLDGYAVQTEANRWDQPMAPYGAQPYGGGYYASVGGQSAGASGSDSSAADNEYVSAVYRAVLSRDPSIDELQSWVKQLESGTSHSAFVNTLDHSDEYYATIIRPAYEKYLGREADDAGLAYWTSQMRAGLTDEQLEAAFIASDEFYGNAGGTDQGWVDSLYQHLLGRSADAQGEAYWVGQLAAGEQRSSVAFGFTASLERERQRITDDYLHYLGRQADEGGLDYWTNQFAHGQTNEDLITGFLASDEYFRTHSG